jgi:hypothetical protein
MYWTTALQGSTAGTTMKCVFGQKVSVAAVRFGPVQHPDFLNLELGLGFGSGNLPNFGLDPGSGPVQVRTRFEPVFSSHAPDALKNLSRSSPASLSFLYCPEALN